MAIDIVVPNLGESISEATVATWFKKQGEAVAADETLLELETDKATLEVPAPSAGVLAEILVAEGEDVEVGAVLGRINEDEDAATSEAPMKEESESSAAVEPTAAPEEAEEAQPEVSGGRPAEPTAIALDPTAIPRSGPDGTVSLADLRNFFSSAAREAVERSGPAVRKMIADHGLNAELLPTTGKDGRITKEDVLEFLASQEEAPTEAAAAAPETKPQAPLSATAEQREERVKMSRLRRTIATRLKESQKTAAILTTFNEIDMSAIIDLRSRYREAFEDKHGVRLGFMSFFVKAVVGALKEMPKLNASLDGDHIVYHHYYNIGMAVSTDAGLKVPVVRDCDRKSFAEIERAIADLAGRAREGSLSLEEMEGGTFSITNGGVFGSLLSTPILNPPQSAILGLHKIEERPVAIDGQIEIRPMMYLAMSYDHRLIDGRESVTFLVRVKELIEHPDRLMLDV
ncbi:MAG: 2-oxoglutarate dehydrogenase complex dihydrolipoyllysine-residue succinyltransferase [Gemmatimonadales bacterium]|jgi:2-oxoglutarate dehydrogenase E2 component (dihydrolipoamide succinyltransferase)